MATTNLQRPSTTEQVLSVAYLANDYRINSAKSISVECDDDDIALVLRMQATGGDQLEYDIPGGVCALITPDRGQVVLLNVKAAAGTPNVKIVVDAAITYSPRNGISTVAVITSHSQGIIDTTLPVAGGDGTYKDILTDVYGRIRLAAESTDQDQLLTQAFGLADTGLPAAVADGEQAQLLTDVYGRLRDAVEDATANANRGLEVDPLNQQFVSETLCELIDIAQSTTGYLYIDMDGFRNLTIQGETSGAAPTDVLTVTVEGTLQDDGTAPASCAYQDISLLCYDAATGAIGTASWVDTDFLIALSPTVLAALKYVRVKYTTSGGGGNDCDLTVFAKKLY